MFYPRASAEMLRDSLEWYPEKVLFGTDASAGSPELSWEKGAGGNHARQAFAVALTGMISEGEVSREQATQIARMVPRENAVKLYGLR